MQEKRDDVAKVIEGGLVPKGMIPAMEEVRPLNKSRPAMPAMEEVPRQAEGEPRARSTRYAHPHLTLTLTLAQVLQQGEAKMTRYGDEAARRPPWRTRRRPRRSAARACVAWQRSRR